MVKNLLNRNGKMLLANWFEIPEKDYIWYKLQGYDIDADSDQVMWRLNDKLHREDGPAYIRADGDQEWYLNGKPHRTDGPAVITAKGTQEWWLNGKLHREDGPAVIYADGGQAWWLNDKLHREDGPAVIWADGTQEWRLNGEELTESEWKNAIGELV